MHMFEELVGVEIRYCGDLELANLPTTKEIFDDDVIEALGNLSEEISNSVVRGLLDKEYIYFAQWIRPRNISRIKDKQYGSTSIICAGRGLTLHIVPTNVKANMLFSLAFGLLAGNSNYIRISGNQHSDYSSVLNILKAWLIKNPEVSKYVLIGTYDTQGIFSNVINSMADARVVWGGDNTVGSLRAMKTKASCHDIYFPDRLSYGYVEMEKLMTITELELSNIARGLAVDISLFSQMACSSPCCLFVNGAKNDASEAMLKRLYKQVDGFIGELGYSQNAALDHLKSSTEVALEYEYECIFAGRYFLVVECKGEEKEHIQRKHAKNSVLEVIWVGSVDSVIKVLPSNSQTLVDLCFEYTAEDTRKAFATKTNLTRIVKPGRALMMASLWDGHDIIRGLSRSVSIGKDY